MLRESLEAFVRGDAKLAQAIPGKDDEVDALYNQVYRELLTLIMADPSTIDQANHLPWAAHNLERAADRVTNICERVIFTVSGEMVELDMETTGPESISQAHDNTASISSINTSVPSAGFHMCSR